MSFSANELANIANAALDFHIKGATFKQSIQDRPLLDAALKAQKTFPGGKENITVGIKGDYTTTIEGYSHDDEVGYANPANLKRAAYPWKELHAGISMTVTELKKDGISVIDTESLGEGDSIGTTEHSNRELTALTNILEDKLDDMSEGWARSFAKMLWLDGTQDSKLIPGVSAFISDVPTTGTIGGVDRAVNTWWRNRSLVGANKITVSVTNQTLTKKLRYEARQLRRFGGKPSLVLAGSDFLDGLEQEVAEKGVYTQQGFVKNGTLDVGLADISMRGVGQFMYDPTLDDLGYNKRCYIIDPRMLQLYVMEDEDRKIHQPARPYNRYVLYRAMTYTGGMVAKQLNCHGVYEIA